MRENTIIKIELGLAAQKIIQQLHFSNEVIERDIAAGIEKAFANLGVGTDAFIENVARTAEDAIHQAVIYSVNSWSVKSKIAESVEKAISDKLDGYCKKIADQVVKDFSGNHQP